ncbi:acyltransferase family protein [Sphaerisporangium sp. NPDC005289]|uniref:acyltransferase family protein n=1 Tax=Sphaerisporangium sp. NPDC005289 TaxID=3155247 RepID=UPI0033BE0DFD
MTRAHDPAGRIWARLAAIRTRCASPDARPRPASPAALPGWRAWDAFAGRIEAGTPATRDRGADALRALAILGVIAGHWLVTAWVVDDLGHLRVTSPLSAMPGLVPLSWVLQTLAVFFFVGGYAAARGLGRAPAGEWVRLRLRRLLVPAGPLLAVWAGLLVLLAAVGVPPGSLRSLAVPALGPLWFLGVYGLLTAVTPLLVRVRPARVAVAAVVLVLVTDVVRFGLGGPVWPAWTNVLAGWLVPYALGLARGAGDAPGLGGGWGAAAMLAGGAVGTVILVTGFGYPASMIGVTGARVSNLSPPTLAAVCFGIAQVSLAMLLHRPLTSLMRRPRVWAAVVLSNLSAMTVFLWHQTALTVVLLAALPFGTAVPGLLVAPDSPGWLLERMTWLPLPAVLVALLCALLLRRDRRSRQKRTT